MEELDFGGKTALVIGGSGGLGNGIAQAFRAHGFDCHVTGTRQSAGDYSGEPGSDLEGVTYHQLNLSNPEVIDRFDPGITKLDALVLSQGITVWDDGEFELDQFRRVIDVNLNSVMGCCTRFKSQLENARGTIVVVNSMAALRATIGLPAYSASKAGLESVTRSLAEAWGQYGIRVNGIAPGFVETRLTREVMKDPKRRQAYLRGVPLGREGTITDVAGVALFLASPLAAFVTGQTIAVEGGRLLR